MDRAAKLAVDAKRELSFERALIMNGCFPGMARDTTRRMVAICAERLGFSSLEISAAVDQALTDAGTTP